MPVGTVNPASLCKKSLLCSPVIGVNGKSLTDHNDIDIVRSIQSCDEESLVELWIERKEDLDNGSSNSCKDLGAKKSLLFGNRR